MPDTRLPTSPKSPRAARAARLAAVVISHDDLPSAVHLVQALQHDDPAWFADVSWLILHNGPAPTETLPTGSVDIPVRIQAIPNRGYGAAINEALRDCDRPYLLVLNSDLLPEPGIARALEHLIDGLEVSATKAGIVGFRLLNPDGSPQGSIGRSISLARILMGLARPRATRKYHVDSSDSRRSVPWVTGAAFLLDRHCSLDLGGFDERFFMYYEDVDLCRRAARAGWEVRFEPAVALRHFHPYHGRSLTHRLVFLARHGLLVYFHKHRPAWEYRTLAWIIQWECRYRVWRESRSSPPTAPNPGTGGWRQVAQLLQEFRHDPAGFRVDPRRLP